MMARLIFRYDDFSAAQWQSRDVDRAVFDLFRRLDVPLVVGVTPCMSMSVHDATNEIFYPIGEDAQGVALLRQGLALGWQLALHGYTHQRTVAMDGTEFVQEPRETQRAKIERGLTTLHRCFPGTRVDVFIPPWNSFDQTTLECMAEAGLSVLCDGDAWHSVRSRDVAVVPSLMSGRKLVDYVRSYSLADLARVLGDTGLVVTLHEYEFRSPDHVEGLSLGDLEEALQQIRSQNITVGTLPLDKNVSYVPRHRRLLRAQLHWLEQMRRGRGRAMLKCTQLVDQRLRNQGGSFVTDLAAYARWESAALYAWMRACLRPLRRLCREGLDGIDPLRA